MSSTAPATGLFAALATARTAAPAHLVLLRVGEFYEALAEDAAVVSRALGIRLTRRRQRDAPDVPMCGVPASAAEHPEANGMSVSQRRGCAGPSSKWTSPPGDSFLTNDRRTGGVG